MVVHRPAEPVLFPDLLPKPVVAKQRRRRRGKAKQITVELDPTEDPTHGGQQLSLCNGHYDTRWDLPIAGVLKFDDEPEKDLSTYVLRSGKALVTRGALGILHRVLEKLTEAFPLADTLVRLDGGFASPKILEYLENAGLDYVVAIARNSELARLAEPLMEQESC